MKTYVLLLLIIGLYYIEALAMDSALYQRNIFIKKIRKQHASDNFYQCPKCSYTIKSNQKNSSDNYRSHIKRCVVPRWQCTQCGISTDSLSRSNKMKEIDCKSSQGKFHSIKMINYDYNQMLESLKLCTKIKTDKRPREQESRYYLRKKPRKDDKEIRYFKDSPIVSQDLFKCVLNHLLQAHENSLKFGWDFIPWHRGISEFPTATDLRTFLGLAEISKARQNDLMLTPSINDIKEFQKYIDNIT